LELLEAFRQERQDSRRQERGQGASGLRREFAPPRSHDNDKEQASQELASSTGAGKITHMRGRDKSV
jgi:hypothetical protein